MISRWQPVFTLTTGFRRTRRSHREQVLGTGPSHRRVPKDSSALYQDRSPGVGCTRRKVPKNLLAHRPKTVDYRQTKASAFPPGTRNESWPEPSVGSEEPALVLVRAQPKLFAGEIAPFLGRGPIPPKRDVTQALAQRVAPKSRIPI